MAEVKLVSPDEAAQLIDQGHTFIDVRSEPEFEAGHVPGALNVPLNHQGPGGMVPNPNFLEVMQGLFRKDENLIVGCKMGGRSAKAAALLKEAGFENLCDMTAGFDGKRDAFGRATPGWNSDQRPVEAGSPPDQAYAALKARAGK